MLRLGLLMKNNILGNISNHLQATVKRTIKENLIIFILIITTWFKLIYLDRIIFDDWPILGVFLIFTLASAMLVFFPVFLFKKAKIYLGLVISFVLSFVLWANTLYYRFFGSLIKVEALSIANQTTDVSDSVLALMRPSDIVYFLDIILIIFFIIYFKYKAPLQNKFKERVITATIVFLVPTLVISVIFFIERHEHLEKFIYRNFDINQIERRYGALGVHGINSYRYFFISNKKIDSEREAEVVAWITKNKMKPLKENSFTGVAENKNIFVLQMESLQNFVIGMELEGQEITPNINKLIKESYYFPNGGYIIGGGKTSDSDFSTNTSLYPLFDSSVFVQHGRHDFTSLPKALSRSGYSTYYYHAYKRDFWNRGVALNSLGFDRFYDENEYPKGTNIIMGLNDVDFYKETLNKVKDKKGFNYHYLNSLTSHYPFDMAPEHQFLTADVDNYDYRTYHYLQSIHYTDYALGKFIEGLKEADLYDDSLIVLYGDHSAKVGDLSDSKTIKTLGIDRVTDEVLYDLQKVPFVVKLPNQKDQIIKKEVVSQLDLMPTILNLVGSKGVYPLFGRDIFGEEGVKYFSVVNDLPQLSVLGDYLYFVDPYVPENNERCYFIKGGWSQRPITECFDLLEKRKQEQQYGWDLVRYNLFHHFY